MKENHIRKVRKSEERKVKNIRKNIINANIGLQVVVIEILCLAGSYKSIYYTAVHKTVSMYALVIKAKVYYNSMYKDSYEICHVIFTPYNV